MMIKTKGALLEIEKLQIKIQELFGLNKERRASKNTWRSNKNQRTSILARSNDGRIEFNRSLGSLRIINSEKIKCLFTKKDVGTFEKIYKARIVATGYIKIKGKKYEEGNDTIFYFSTVLWVAGHNNYAVRFFNVKTAY